MELDTCVLVVHVREGFVALWEGEVRKKDRDGRQSLESVAVLEGPARIFRGTVIGGTVI